MQPAEWDVVAKDYFNEVTSPFDNGVSNPLVKEISKINSASSKTVIDLGCGIGNLVPYVKQFNRVACLDFSPGMIKQARLQHGNNEHITFHEKDITELKEFHNQFDVAVAVNSFIMPDLEQVNRAFKEAYNVLKEKGQFFGVFPSMESVAYQFMLCYEYYVKKLKDQKKAYLKAQEEVNAGQFDFRLGILNEEGFQKHFYRQGIKYRLKKAGLTNIEFGRVEYPWKMTIIPNHKRFENEDKTWDWFVKASK